MTPSIPAAEPRKNGSTLLFEIREPDTPLVMWERDIPGDVVKQIQTWLSTGDCCVEEEIHVDQMDVRGLLAARLAENGWSENSKTGNWLIDDLTDLVYRFSEVADTCSLLFRLESLRDSACCKFHTDYLTLRMLCTYFGPGTEWAPEEAVCHEEIGCTADSTAAANRRIIPNPETIQRTASGTVLLFKGNRYPGTEGRGLVHRSAPVSAPHHTRLLLRIDPVQAGL
ncbi:DUF1826 domain-containing protein [Pontiella agarivorans]|uniref:DUF1826 domain-containing protein n=1 Tax=Pontiella agarivorans TaxID=3038953 RepID=A0ABU5MUT9_9BACT|nr:DUF1826 domain-containing protein [Pontiella agarivorans]MDZ8117902.1 DUF1826 domain-containing protein [Pontiella agarivorans]